MPVTFSQTLTSRVSFSPMIYFSVAQSQLVPSFQRPYDDDKSLALIEPSKRDRCLSILGSEPLVSLKVEWEMEMSVEGDCI